MWTFFLKYTDTTSETKSFNSYGEFVSAYWKAMSDRKVAMVLVE